jgi:hypothetical protein
VDRGACALAEARSVGQALRLLLGRRHPFGGPARGPGAVHPGHHRRDAGRQEGTRRLHRWSAREFTIVARSAVDLKRRGPTTAAQIAVAKPALAKAGARARVLEGARRGMTDNPRATLLGSQDRARHGLQACRGRPEKLAPDRRPQPVAKTDPGCEVHRRDRGLRRFCRASIRRLILQAVTKIRR